MGKTYFRSVSPRIIGRKAFSQAEELAKMEKQERDKATKKLPCHSPTSFPTIRHIRKSRAEPFEPTSNENPIQLCNGGSL